MSNIFGSLQIAKTGLYVSQQALNVIGNNISNANTDGYTRQTINIESIDPSVLVRFHQGVSSGKGATVTDIEQVRSDYIDKQLRGEYSSQNYWNTRSDEMGYIDSIINETSDHSSITSALANFYTSLSALSSNPDKPEIRTNVQQSGIKLCETLNYYYGQLVDQQNSYNNSMKTTVDSINGYLTSIADYNKQIAAYELGGQTASSLRDKRNVAVDGLSKLINIDYSEDSDGNLNISTGGSALVSGADATLLEAEPELTGEVSGETGYYQIYRTGDSDPLEYTSGQLKAYKDLRDGDTSDNIGIPYLLSNLNTLSQSLSKAFNEVHETGYTMPYGSNNSQTGIDFFKVPSGDYSNITAGNISLSDEVVASSYNIAASSEYVEPSSSNSQQGNNEVALKLYALTSSDGIADVGNFEDYLKSFIVTAGISSTNAGDLKDSESSIVENLENRREATSGVSIDEEMVNLMSSQHAYQAAARVLTAIDEILSTLINNTGRVGL